MNYPTHRRHPASRPGRIEIHTPAHMLRDPAVRGGLYGVVQATLMMSKVKRVAGRQLSQYPGHVERVLELVRQAWGHELTPAQVAMVRTRLWPDPELERHAYPGQPSHRSAPPVQPCTCWYLCLICGLDLTHAWCKQEGVDLTWCYHPASPVPHRATGFRINPHCPHHGTAALQPGLQGQRVQHVVIDEAARFEDEKANEDCNGE